MGAGAGGGADAAVGAVNGAQEAKQPSSPSRGLQTRRVKCENTYTVRSITVLWVHNKQRLNKYKFCALFVPPDTLVLFQNLVSCLLKHNFIGL